MKKIFILFIFVLLAISAITVSQAQAAKKYVSISELRLGISGIAGLNQTSTYRAPNTIAALLFSTGKYKGKFGLNYQSATAAGQSTSIFGFFTSHEWNLSLVNKISTHTGISILYTTDSNYPMAAGGTAMNIMQLGPYYGYTYEPLDNFEISLDFMPLGYMSIDYKNVYNMSGFNLLGKAFISANYYF